MYIKSTLLGSAILLSGCANLNSIHHEKTLSEDKPSVFSMDARQRAIISRTTMEEVVVYERDKNGKKVKNEDGIGYKFEIDRVSGVRMCAEQFPDVFTVLSASLSAQLAAKNEEGAQSLSGSLAAAMQESGTTIARTQTVNLLREAMFRTCERYMNGALDKDSFVLQAMRDQQNMVSVLAIEQLTGVVTPPSSSLFGVSGAVGAYQEQETELMKMTVDAKTKLDEAAAEETKSQTEFDTALATGNGDGQTCASIPDAANKQACSDAQKRLDVAKAKHASEQVYSKRVGELVDANSKSAQAALAISMASNQPNINNNALRSGRDLAIIANAVKGIVESTFNANNLGTACIQIILSDKATNKNLCETYLKAKAEADTLIAKEKAAADTRIAQEEARARIYRYEREANIREMRERKEMARYNRLEEQRNSVRVAREKREAEAYKQQEELRFQRLQTSQTGLAGGNNPAPITSIWVEIRSGPGVSQTDLGVLASHIQQNSAVRVRTFVSPVTRTNTSITLSHNSDAVIANQMVALIDPYISSDINCQNVNTNPSSQTGKIIEIYVPTGASVDQSAAAINAGSNSLCTN